MDNIPTEFVCPITMEIMVHPVATRYGQNFERSALVAWLDQGADECPLTRRPLRMSDLINNHQLAQKIRSWKELQGLLLSDTPSSSDDGMGSEQGQELEGDDDVLVFMYGTANPYFQLPMLSIDSPPLVLSVELSSSRESPSRTAADVQPDSPNVYHSSRSKSRPILQRFRLRAPKSGPRRQ
jgi:U-box domain